MTTWFTSDTHFNHARILEYCPGRPWKTVPEMNEGIIERWNARVQPGDRVYHLGDFAMGDKTLAPAIVQRLNGRKTIFEGNHDPKTSRLLEWGFEEVAKWGELKLDGFWVYLRHYPLGGHDGDRAEEPGDYDYRLCGHIHDLWKNRGSEINAGVDVWDCTPRTFAELIEGIPPRTWPTMDWAKHHMGHRGMVRGSTP